ncbi:MAG: hypothetical protein Q8K36_00730, partial [Alphaproteobacteria bacterium]|nr:hypothetical protein [Alphaproteobacteria bacterium]
FANQGQACNCFVRPMGASMMSKNSRSLVSCSNIYLSQMREQHMYTGQYIDVTNHGMLQIKRTETSNFLGIANLGIKPKKIWPVEARDKNMGSEMGGVLPLSSFSQPVFKAQSEALTTESPSCLGRFIFPQLESYVEGNIFSVIYGEIFPIAHDMFITSAHNILRVKEPHAPDFVSALAQDIRLYGYEIINLSWAECIPYTQIMLYCFIHPLWYYHKIPMFNIAVVFLSKKYTYSDQQLHDILSNHADDIDDYDIQFVNREVGLLGKKEYEEIQSGVQIVDAPKIVYFTKKLDGGKHQEPKSFDPPYTHPKDTGDNLQLRSDLVPFLDESIQQFQKFTGKTKASAHNITS